MRAHAVGIRAYAVHFAAHGGGYRKGDGGQGGGHPQHGEQCSAFLRAGAAGLAAGLLTIAGCHHIDHSPGG